VLITAVGNMKIHVRLRYVFSFGEKVSGGVMKIAVYTDGILIRHRTLAD